MGLTRPALFRRQLTSHSPRCEVQPIWQTYRNPSQVSAFSEKYNLAFPLLSDYEGKVVRKYGVLWKSLGGMKGYYAANRAMFLADDGGRLVCRWIAENPGKYPDFDAVKKAL